MAISDFQIINIDKTNKIEKKKTIGDTKKT